MAEQRPIRLKTVLEKIHRDETLTEEEEMFYLTKVLKLDQDEANTVIAIAKNEDPAVIID
jgi:hypothetical protein